MSEIVNNFSWAQTLPEEFQVYVLNHQASTTAKLGSELVVIPTNNDYRHNPACYMVCYRHQKGLYSPNNDDIFVTGQVRIAGVYDKHGICQPTKAYDASLCEAYFPACANHTCWAGGDSGGWYRNA